MTNHTIECIKDVKDTEGFYFKKGKKYKSAYYQEIQEFITVDELGGEHSLSYKTEEKNKWFDEHFRKLES